MSRVLQDGFIFGTNAQGNKLVWGGVLWVLINCSYAYISAALVCYIEPAGTVDPNPTALQRTVNSNPITM
jgi:hypothetical protein